jgi:hypothetical protein
MQRRTLWIVLATIGALLTVICVGVSVAGYLVYTSFNAAQAQQQQRFEEILRELDAAASAVAELPTTAAEDERPTVTPRPASPEPTKGPTEQPDAGPSDGQPISPPAEGDVAASLVAGSRAALAQRQDAPAYRISAALDPERHTINGSQRVTLTNAEDTPLDAIYFRLYINAAHYNEGEMTVADVRVNGAPVEPALEVDDTALKLPLAQPLAPGQTAEIELRFTATIPDSDGGYGLFNEDDGVFMLYNWHPELAVFEDGAWQLDPVSDQGDPTNTDVANYVVSFAAPDSFTVVTGGVPTSESASDGQTAHSFVAALTRNFVVVASDRFERAEQQVGETMVRSYYRAEDEAGGKTALETAARALELFGQQFGPYPFTELDVVEVELGGGAAGMESTGMVMIGQDYYDPEQGNPFGEAGAFLAGAEGGNVLAFTTAHEVAHQWWYGVVGSDAYEQPWLDESLTNWSSAYYVDQVEGEEAGALARDLFISAPYRDALSSGDVRLDQPVDQFSADEYGAIVYGKGALMYDVLRQELGEAAFSTFLQNYYREYAFDRADGADWLRTLNEAAGKDMTSFYQKWVESTSVREEDLPPGGPLTDLLNGQFDSLLPEASDGP